ncbi:Ketosteroid isomerase-related protein [Parafrankia irregularis]|uniref:Ketosteroid isomerase-related protein n=1 Tax=Parafrankia irregularis TaxID=795642 RepID=A0A0S4QVE0_9ACTN|nr:MULTISPECIES: nuclear transport factor 2 family protein [Parafrankia]MBE3203703.1 nuclear transport factor 2 family protein [Parafrankia sp. CH37]CUU59054.1 Ketosteroid isomerase-related protein [Parafrankia irregularis]
MLPTPAPADVVRMVAVGVSRLVRGDLTPDERERQLDMLAGLYGERTDVRHPFAPLGDQPMRTRAELRQHFAGSAGRVSGVRRFAPTNMVVHRTADPEVVVAEFAYTGTAEPGEFAVQCVFVVRVRDGQIIESRDYADHIGMARAVGRLEPLARALADGTGRASDELAGAQLSRDLALRMHAAFNALDLPAVDEIFAADFFSHPLQFRGPAAVKERWLAMRAAAPDLRTEIADLIAEDDRAVIRSRLTDGTGELLEIIRIAQGRIAELWGARTGPVRT